MHDPSNVTSAFAGAVIAQWAFLLILAVGGMILRVLGCPREGSAAAWLGLVSGVTGLGLLAFSSGVTDAWALLLGNLSVHGGSLTGAVGASLSVDLITACILVALSGGTKVSPFKETYFFLPVLAIFLHQPLRFVIGYSIAAAACFILTLFVATQDHGEAFRRGLQLGDSSHERSHTIAQAYKISYAIISLGCFGVTSFIGIALEYAQK